MYSDARVSSAHEVLHRWVVEFESTADTRVLSELQLLVSDFAEFLAGGACASLERGVGCGFEVLDNSRDRFQWRFALRGNDVRYVRLLRNTLVAFSETVLSIRTTTVEQVPAADQSLSLAISPEEVALGTFYPPALPRLPFRIDREEPYRLDRGRKLLIEYSCSIDSVIERSLERVVDLWTRCAQFGYCPDEGMLVNGDFGIHGVEHAVFDEQTYEVTIEVFDVPEEAFSLLLNSLAFMPEPVRCWRVTII